MRRSLPSTPCHPPTDNPLEDEAASELGRRPRRYHLLWMEGTSVDIASVAESGAPAWTRVVVYARDLLTGRVRRLELVRRRLPTYPPDGDGPPAPAAALRLAEEPSPPGDLGLPAAA